MNMQRRTKMSEHDAAQINPSVLQSKPKPAPLPHIVVNGDDGGAAGRLVKLDLNDFYPSGRRSDLCTLPIHLIDEKDRGMAAQIISLLA